ncbi:MAG: invasion associated locus B family protein [Hyphomicrobiaceae bacterium]
MPRAAIKIAALLLVAVSALPGRLVAAEMTGSNGDWRTYRHGAGDDLMCFAVTKASDASGGDRESRKPHVYVTAWPKAGIKGEVSVLIGQPLRKGAEITIGIGDNSFTLFADGDRAYVGDTGEETRLLEAMRRGKTMTVTASTADGNSVKDVYSLSGVTASVQSISTSCQ